jgi:hypothetical protein
VNAVTVQDAIGRLSAAVDELWAALGELVLIVLEDQPEDDGLAVTDQLVETVSELQGAVAEARSRLATGDESPSDRSLLAELPAVATLLGAADARYWRDVRGHEAVVNMRAGTRVRGGDWPAWRRTVELSAMRCAEPLDAVRSALDDCWQQVCRLVAGTPDPARLSTDDGSPRASTHDPHSTYPHSSDQPRSAP